MKYKQVTADEWADFCSSFRNEEADPIFWLCNTCEASDRGSPVDLLED